MKSTILFISCIVAIFVWYGLGAFLFSQQPPDIWRGFYFVGGHAQADYFIENLQSKDACIKWALNILHTDKSASNQDTFYCSAQCMGSLKTGFQCKDDSAYQGSFETVK